MKKSQYIGMMSGTSLDGIDICHADFSQPQTPLIHQKEYPFPQDLKNEILELCQNNSTTIEKVGLIDHKLGQLYANVVLKFTSEFKINTKEILAIGCHGQTVWHSPEGPYPFTIQLGDLNIIAVKTGIKTIGDFRRKDIALGGQGAPLVPIFHNHFFKSDTENRIILNIGGISNITKLYINEPITGYDTGPGNILLDAWIRKVKGLNYDQNGLWASTGTVNKKLLKILLSDPYFIKPAPKSTGREKFNIDWIENILKNQFDHIPEQDVMATLTELTAQSIANEINSINKCNTVIVCGGGAYNKDLLHRLKGKLNKINVTTSLQYNIDPLCVESIAFAWLAKIRNEEISGNIPSVTGAREDTLLGTIVK